MIDLATIGAGCAVFAMGAWGAIEQQRRKRAETRAASVQSTLNAGSTSDLAQRNTDLVKSYREKADEWKSLFEQQHKEIIEYRKFVHEKNEKDNSEKLKLVEENTRLNARTDLTPLIDHMQSQSQTNERVAETLNTLTEGVNRLLVWLSEQGKHHDAKA